LTRFLGTELIAGETDHDQASVLVFQVEILNSLVLTRESARRGDIDDEDDLSSQLIEGVTFAFDVHGFEIIE